jgi:hypothetical protein
MEWNPNSGFNFILMDENVKNEEIIKEFVCFHNLPLIVNDICYYAREYNKYPYKITNSDMEFLLVGGSRFITIDFRKPNIHIYKYLIRLEYNPLPDIIYKCIGGAEFNYKNFKDLLEI